MVGDLTDGVVFLRPLGLADAAEHLAGEDIEIAKWLSGGTSTLASVEGYILRCQENWRDAGPLRAFGVFDSRTGRLAGSIEANLALLCQPGQVNVSYGVFPAWRGKGIAVRALQLMSVYLRTSTEARQMVLRISAKNAASIRAAEKSDFIFVGVFDEPEGSMVRYARNLG